MIPCSRAQFGHSVSFCGRHLRRVVSRQRTHFRTCAVDAPLVVAVVAHEVHRGEVEPALARRALRDVEHARVVRVRELLDLPQLRLRLRAIRCDQFLVLHGG